MTGYQLRICIFVVLREHCAQHAGCRQVGCPDPSWSLDRDEFARAVVVLAERFGDALANELVGWRITLAPAAHVSVDQVVRVCDPWLANYERARKLESARAAERVVAPRFVRRLPAGDWHAMQDAERMWCGRLLAAQAGEWQLSDSSEGYPVCAECLEMQK